MNTKYEYRIRPGYGSENILIEFTKNCDGNEFHESLKNVLGKINVKSKQIDDLWMNDEMLYHIKSDIGKFQISSDSWGGLFILADNNQEAINELGYLLSHDDRFLKEEVDYKKYR